MDAEFERAVQSAKHAHDREDWLDAIEHWKNAVRLNPKFFEGYWMGGGLLLQLGQLDEAEAMLSKGVALKPTHVPIAVQHAKAATLLKNWPEAIRRWNAVSRRAPTDDALIAARAEAEMQMQLYRLDEAAGVGSAAINWKRFQAGRISSEDTELFMRFQSLGDNCEFGLVQRYFRAEPISLLRWNRVYINYLIEGINNDFRGVGDPANTDLIVGQNEEYAVMDRRYVMAMHTFLKKHQVTDDPEELYVKMCKRQAYLARKLVEDLKEPDQIFVYKSVEDGTLENAIALHSAMQRHGRNHLLLAIEANDEWPAGTVKEIKPRLFVGSIEHFSRLGEGWDNLNFDTWRSVCREVLQKVDRFEVAARFLRRITRRLGYR